MTETDTTQSTQSIERIEKREWAGEDTDTLEPGIWEGIPDRRYHTIPYPSFHRLVPVVYESKSWAHYRLAMVQSISERPTAAMRRGTAVHLAVLQPEAYEREIIAGPINPRTGKSFGVDTKAFREAEDADPDLTVVPSDAIEDIPHLVEQVLYHEQVQMLLTLPGVLREPTVITDIPVAGGTLRMKWRPDVWAPDEGVIADLKTCQIAARGPFSRDIGKYHYHGQAGLYCHLAAASGYPDPAFMFIAVESEPLVWADYMEAPHYGVVCHALDAVSTAAGWEQIAPHLSALEECIRTDTWPGYPAGIAEISAPSWALGGYTEAIWD